MDTLHTTTAHVSQTKAIKKENILQRFERQAEFNRFAIISINFLIIGIVGGITIALGAFEHVWQIGAIATMTMLSLSLMLAVSPMKYIIRVTAATVILDLLLLLMNGLM